MEIPDTFSEFLESNPAQRLPEWAIKKRSFLSPYLEKAGPTRAPWRFQWVIKRKLALMAWPQYPEHLRFLLKIGIRRLVCLTPESRPPIHMFTEFYYIEIPVEELTAPTLEQIKLFICFCDQAKQFDEPVGVHDRVGRGRSGVFAACYLVRYCGLTAEMAIMQLRKTRPGAIETKAQEKAVHDYYEELCRCPPDNACWQPENYM
ncbi:unnamed protein product [Orchesella dallaii]|uniref:Dual specificity protein phosphatase 23 n=1 Tax=Orchesella dallaii TaxID=48710 RepID=A0ABP1QVB3_9HEXA